MTDLHGGMYRATPPTYTDGQRVEEQFDTRGNMKVAVSSGGTALSYNQDGISLVPSALYTSTQTAADQTNLNARGLIVVLDATAVTAVGSFTLTIQGKDAVSGKYFTLLAGAAVTTVSTNVYTVYPGCPATANVSANAPLPKTWRVIATYNSGTNLTFSVGASLIV